jgi:hypothetical protein
MFVQLAHFAQVEQIEKQQNSWRHYKDIACSPWFTFETQQLLVGLDKSSILHLLITLLYQKIVHEK